MSQNTNARGTRRHLWLRIEAARKAGESWRITVSEVTDLDSASKLTRTRCRRAGAATRSAPRRRRPSPSRPPRRSDPRQGLPRDWHRRGVHAVHRAVRRAGCGVPGGYIARRFQPRHPAGVDRGGDLQGITLGARGRHHDASGRNRRLRRRLRARRVLLATGARPRRLRSHGPTTRFQASPARSIRS